MKFTTNPKEFINSPHPRYAKMAKLLREEGLDVQDHFELIDLVVKECDRLLDLRSFLNACL